MPDSLRGVPDGFVMGGPSTASSGGALIPMGEPPS
ncbi:hypothetical protein IWX75_001037 [Arthrobacter sp. CAN_A6]